jgi:arylsulfatase A-like enzyme
MKLSPLLCFLALGVIGHAAERPNIVVILSDDVGYSDIGCFGGEIATPNLDALAAGGLRFTNFYNTARCCPTRASLLTGLHPHQAGIGHMLNDDGVDSYRGELSRRSVTIAEALKPAGYRNYIVGKWHLTPGYSAEAQAKRDNWPLQRGFDRYYGTIQGAGSFWDPGSLVRDNTLITVANDPEYRPAEYYYTDAISDHATKFIREHARDHARSPFFLYVPYTAPHWPMHARESDIAKQQGRYDAGYAAIRAARWAKQKQLGVVDAAWGFAPTSGDWGKVENKAFEARCMEVYAAMLTSMDEGIGRIVAALKATGQLDNTVIIYLQDNGACAETNGREGPFTPRAAKPSLPPLAPESQEKLKDLRGQVERMGEVNVTAIEEHQEIKDRYAFLSKQKGDLEDSLRQLRDAIEKIDETSRQRFKETFDIVNEKFQQVFPRLFGGGRGSLMLTNPAPGEEPGVEILAQPPQSAPAASKKNKKAKPEPSGEPPGSSRGLPE